MADIRVRKEQDELGINYCARRNENAQIMTRVCQRDMGVSLKELLLTQTRIVKESKLIIIHGLYPVV